MGTRYKDGTINCKLRKHLLFPNTRTLPAADARAGVRIRRVCISARTDGKMARILLEDSNG